MFDGWVPTEVHVHYDAAGVETGRTEVTRESEWDDTSRGRALRLTEYKGSLCKCGCGNPVESAYDPKQAFIVHPIVCQAGRAIEQVRRADTEKAKDAQKPEGWDDGRHYVAVPHETETRKEP